MASTLQIQTTQAHPDPDMIDLGIGQPQLALLPLQIIKNAAQICFSSGNADYLQYGSEQGDGYLRLALADFISREYSYPINPQELFITNGASQGLDLICTLFTRPGDTIFIEEPSYFLALKILADHGLNLVGIPVDKDGLDLNYLEAELKRNKPTMLYTIPTFHNPGGFTLSSERRDRLAYLSKKFNFLIVADEVYHLLNYATPPPPAFASLINKGNILSLGSFSKILAPGLRLGWIISDSQRMKILVRCGLVDSGGGLNPFTSAIVRNIIETNKLELNIIKLRQTYSIRAAAMDSALSNVPYKLDYQIPSGGYFYWVRLPEEIDAVSFLSQAENFKVSFRPGVHFSTQGKMHDYLRLCFAYYEAETLIQGINRLGNALKFYLNNAS